MTVIDKIEKKDGVVYIETCRETISTILDGQSLVACARRLSDISVRIDEAREALKTLIGEKRAALKAQTDEHAVLLRAVATGCEVREVRGAWFLRPGSGDRMFYNLDTGELLLATPATEAAGDTLFTQNAASTTPEIDNATAQDDQTASISGEDRGSGEATGA